MSSKLTSIRPFLLWNALVFYVLAQSTQICYLPDHSPDNPGNTPCNLAAQFSHCCNIADICLTNGYCLGTTYSNLYRPSCTDPTFKDNSCPYECADVNTGGGSMLSLVNHQVPTLWCCESGYNNITNECDTPTQGSSAPFQIGPSMIINNRTSGSTGPNNTVTQVIQQETSTPTTFVTVTPSPHGSSSSSSSHDLAIGLGVGLPLGLLLLITSGLLFRQVQKQTQKSSDGIPGKVDLQPDPMQQRYEPYYPKPELSNQEAAVGELCGSHRAVEMGD